MPTAPPKACHCGGRKTNGVCDRCGPTKDDRKSTAERGYGPRWRKYSDGYLRRNPLCVCCDARGVVEGARGRTGLRTDHIIPASLAPELFWEPTNHQSLCLSCDMTYKQPIEKRCSTGEQVRKEWESLMRDMQKRTLSE